MRQLDDWVQDIMLRLPGVTRSVVENQLFNTAQQFFRESRAWTVRLPFIVDNTKTYVYLAPTVEGAMVGTVLRVIYDERVINPLTVEPIDDPQAGLPRGFYLHDSGTMQLFPQPEEIDNGKDLLVDVSLIPESFDTLVPDDTWIHHRQSIICGTVAELLNWPNRPWSNDNKAIREQRKFKNETLMARKEVLARFSRGNASWVFPPWA
jgi:hypothetical protein